MVIEVMKGDNKPYYLSSTGPRPNGTYIRVGRSKRQATDGEIISMIRDYSKSNWEDEISPKQELHFHILIYIFTIKTWNLEKINISLSALEIVTLNLRT